jgi:hypothetical protein
MHLKTLIGGAVVFAPCEIFGSSRKTFGMADEAAGIQAVVELVDEALLFGFIEIDHDVAAEDDVVAARQEFGLQVVKVELDKLFELGLDGVLVAGLFEVTQPAGVVNGLHLLIGIETFLSNAETGVADVRSENFEFPGRRNERLG